MKNLKDTFNNAKKAKKPYFIEKVIRNGKVKYQFVKKQGCYVLFSSESHEVLRRQAINSGYLAKDIEILF